MGIDQSRKPNQTFLMRIKINKAISHLGLEIAGGGRDGCFYFVSTETDASLDHTVYVSAMSHLPVSQWVEEAEEAQTNQPT